MNKDHTTVEVSRIPNCDICRQKGVKIPSTVDGKTIKGPWAYMCDPCFGAFGVGLGPGLGQRLVLR